MSPAARLRPDRARTRAWRSARRKSRSRGTRPGQHRPLRGRDRCAAMRRMFPRLSFVPVRISAALAAAPIIREFANNNKIYAYLSPAPHCAASPPIAHAIPLAPIFGTSENRRITTIRFHIMKYSRGNCMRHLGGARNGEHTRNGEHPQVLPVLSLCLLQADGYSRPTVTPGRRRGPAGGRPSAGG